MSFNNSNVEIFTTLSQFFQNQKLLFIENIININKHLNWLVNINFIQPPCEKLNLFNLLDRRLSSGQQSEAKGCLMLRAFFQSDHNTIKGHSHGMQETMRLSASITKNAAIFRINSRNRVFRLVVQSFSFFTNSNWWSNYKSKGSTGTLKHHNKRINSSRVNVTLAKTN